MKRSIKVILDIIMGAIVPIMILTYLSGPLGNIFAYLISAVVPTLWILLDLFVITRRMNLITSYLGLSAILRGLLAFWFVDGALFAFKDTVSFIITTMVFGISLMIHRPIMRYFMIQGLDPDTPEREQSLLHLLNESPVHAAILRGCWIVVIANLLGSAANFFTNLAIVTAPFGSDLFNFQVARATFITRIFLSIPEVIALGFAVWIITREIYRQLPFEEGKSQLESDFWELVQLREGGPQPQEEEDTRLSRAA